MQPKLSDIPVPDAANPLLFYGRVFVLVLIAWFSWHLIPAPLASNAAGASFLHLVNLPFHEAGHIIFRPFGRFMTSLGGSLGQLLMPLVCLFVLRFKTRDAFGAAVCLWWFGENFLDMAPYINDARSLSLPLVGGNVGHEAPYGFHDWEFILSESGLLRYDHTLARIAQFSGSMIMLAAMIWGGYWLWRQYRLLNGR
ncbi:MAG TPA: hypothetical protein VNI58_02025 [Mariprofundaceae bacterium]|nr:hypothetical protein [Mariprofundaceae bacterium]